MGRYGLPGPLLPLALILLVDMCVGGTKVVTSPSKLRFSKSGTLKILQVTDLHQGASRDADHMNDEVSPLVVACYCVLACCLTLSTFFRLF